MRAVMLSTSSGETDKYAHSVESVYGGNVPIVRYDVPNAQEPDVYAAVKALRPELILYIGTRWGQQPSTATLARMNEKLAPMVHLCSDAADPPWWDLLREYDERSCFQVQVAIDGNDNWPGSQRGMTLLTPVDPANFSVTLPHIARPIACGYGGNPGTNGGVRRSVLWETMSHNLLTVRMRDGSPDTYDDYCRFILQSRMSLNIPHTGTESKYHVKGRVIESGLAGCCLLEIAGSPTNKWFAPDREYLEYASMDQLRGYIRDLRDSPEETQLRGERLRERILAEHTPQIFWAKVLDRIGMKAAA